MQKTTPSTIRYYLKWVIWILVVQSVLANISAAIYAYKFTHFYDGPAPAYTSQNVLSKTWKLFVGPSFHKNMEEPEPTFAYQNFTLHTSDNIPIDGWYSN